MNRVYYFDKTHLGSFTSKTLSLSEHLSHLRKARPACTLIAWDQEERGPITDQVTLAVKVFDTIETGLGLGDDPMGVFMGFVRGWHYCAEFEAQLALQGRKLPLDGFIPPAAVPEPGPKKPPRLKYVSDWIAEVERDDPGTVARRAWDATTALCKGK